MKKWSLLFCLLASLLLSSMSPCHAGDSSSFTPSNVSAVASSSGAVPVGTVIIWPFTSNPSGWNEGKWLECNGQSITSSAYPELYALGYSSVPDFRNRVAWGHTTPRTVKSAGLPNITGNHPVDTNASTISGAFYAPGGYFGKQSASGTGGAKHLYFDASRCSSIYGASNTVQPPALTTRFLIRAKP